jgi:hypothetical protein
MTGVAHVIEGCEKLHQGDGGKFSHLEINEYLGFFEDLWLLMQSGVLGRANNRSFFWCVYRRGL